MMKIVALDGFTLNPGDNPWDQVHALGELVIHDRTPADQIIERAAEAEILIVNKVRIGERELQALPRLKFISVTATGFDCVDVDTAKRLGVPVSNVPVYGTDSVAQFVMGQLLHACHRIADHDRSVRDGEWQRRSDFSFWISQQIELRGKTFGIIGFGRIGKRVAELAAAFGMQVLAHTRSPQAVPMIPDFRWVDLATLRIESDVISLHCPLTAETQGLVNRDFLRKCKSNLILLNASRGGLVVETDLATALNEERIAAAMVDVVSTEPVANTNPLLRARNCWITPHMAWATLEARTRLMSTTAANIRAFQTSQPQNVVNP